MAMFKNKALYVQMVNPAKHQPHYVQIEQQQAAEISEIPKWVDDSIKEYGLLALKGALVLMAANAAFTTVSQIIVNQSSPRRR